MTQQQPDGGGGDVEPLRRAVAELRDVLESKVSLVWVELIEPQGELLDQLREEVRERRKRKERKKSEYRKFLEGAVTTIASQLYGVALRERAFDSQRAIIAEEVSDDLASRVDSEAVLQTLRGAIATVFDEARNRLEVSSTLAIADIKKGKSYFELPAAPLGTLTFFGRVAGASEGHGAPLRISWRDHRRIERDPPRPGRWVRFNQWLDSCRKDIELVRYQGGVIFVPAIMSKFDGLIVQPQPPDAQQ